MVLPLPEPWTCLSVLPTMEVDFQNEEELHPAPPPTIEPRFLWEAFANLHEKLGSFGRKYKQVHGVLRSWQPKLDTLYHAVEDMHHKQSELVHRFLNIEGQDPPGHITTLYEKTQGLDTGMNTWIKFSQDMHQTLLQIMQWQQGIGGLKILPAQFASLQTEVQNLATLLQEFQTAHENANTQRAAEKLANDTQFLRINGVLQKIPDWIRGLETRRFPQEESRLAQL